MLLATQVMDVPSLRYIDADHPLQVLMRSTLADFAGLEPDEIPIADRRLRRPRVLPLAAPRPPTPMRG